jgi:peptidyl-prolyl cis-trans isomerase D
MFDFVAKHKRYLQVILAITILPFAFFGIDAYTRAARSGGDAASVDGSTITLREYADEVRRQQDRVRQVLGAGADLSVFDTPEMRIAVLESLVSQRLMTNEVASASLVMSKDEVIANIIATPEFQEGGRFSSERYANYLRATGMSDELNVLRLRVEIPAARLAGAVAGSAFQPKTVAARLAALEGERREVAEAFISSEAFVARVKPDEAAAKAYYDSHQAEYKTPERVRAEFLVLSAEELSKGDAVTDAELKAAYDARASQYTVPEQRRASHILLGTKEEADQVLAELRKSPERFAELAKSRSQDTGSAASGGDLGMNPKGSLASKVLEDAIFALKPNELGEAVKSEFGFHVIRLVAIQPGKVRALDEVRAELTADIAKQKGAKKFAEAAEGFNNLVYEQSDSLKPAAERYKLKIASTGWFTRQGSADIGPLAHPKLLAALFSPDATKQRRNTDAVEVSPGVLVAARVAEHQAEALRPLEEVKADVLRRLARREAATLAKQAAEEKLAILAKGGEAGLVWAAAKTVSRQDAQGLPAPALRKVMTADASKVPAYTGVERGDEGYAIYRIGQVIPFDPKASGAAPQDPARFNRQAGAEQLEAYVASLRARAKIELHPSNLEKN